MDLGLADIYCIEDSRSGYVADASGESSIAFSLFAINHQKEVFLSSLIALESSLLTKQKLSL